MACLINRHCGNCQHYWQYGYICRRANSQPGASEATYGDACENWEAGRNGYGECPACIYPQGDIYAECVNCPNNLKRSNI